MKKPNLIEVFSPAGESSGWELRHPDTNELLWTDNLSGLSEESVISRAQRLGGKVIILGTGRPFPAFKEYPDPPKKHLPTFLLKKRR